MKEEYFNAIVTLGEILLEKTNELSWKKTQLEMRDKEVEQLKIRLEYLESFVDNASNRNEKD